MAASLLSYSILLLFLFSATIHVSIAARTTPQVVPKKEIHAKHVSTDKKQKECEEGTIPILGIGRYQIGTASVPIPDITNWDHSVPAAMNGHYLPGVDDTIIPNPGLEIPNPFHPSDP